MKNKYGFGKKVPYSFNEALQKVTAALQTEGFGVLTEIDVAATLKKKLNKDMPPYRILGACNPPFAHQVLEIEQSIGLLLPCNVVVRQDASGSVFVEFMDPNAMVLLVENPQINNIAAQVTQRLENVMRAL